MSSISLAPPASTLHAEVARAWMEVLHVAHCEPSQRWQDAGGDSLAILHLLHRLERSCGRALPFDAITPETRPGDLVSLLEAGVRVVPGNLPTVHLLPGIYGDGPGLAAFRRALGAEMCFEVIEIADLREPAAVLCSMRRSGELAARTISRQQPSGPIFLAGFSFGGGVAYEAAQALIEAGRQVAFLGILDTAFGATASGVERTRRQRLRFALRNVLRRALSGAIARTLLLRSWNGLPWRAAYRVRRFAQDLFRRAAHQEWSPVPICVEVFLAASEEFAPRTLPIWRRLGGRLSCVLLPGPHARVLNPPALDSLIAAFGQGVREAMQRQLRAAP